MRVLTHLNNLKNVTNKNTFIVTSISWVNLQKSLVLLNHEMPWRTKFKIAEDRVRNIHTFGKKMSKTFNFSRSENNSIRDDEDSTNTVTHNTGKALESPNKYSFRVECNKQEEYLLTQLQIENHRADQMTDEKWDLLRRSTLDTFGTLNDRNVDAVILNKCAQLKLLTLGKSYFRYLKSTNKQINRATYGNYLRLFYSCVSDCNSDDLNEIINIYKELLEVYPILDSHTAEKAVCALSITKEWKEYEKLFVTIKQFYPPTTYIYKLVILTAFDHEEFELGWKLMEEMQYEGLNVPEEVFLYWLQKVSCRMLEEDFLRVLNFLNHFNIKPSDNLCKAIKVAFEEYNDEGKVMFTRVARNGECRHCHSKLEPCNVSQEDFDELKKEFLNPILVGKDMFQKTKPEEFEQFLRFLKKSTPFDVVLDGLNISLQSKNRSISDNSHRLKTVVQHFVTLNKKNILVLGRKHMASWKTPHMDYVFRNAHVFLTEDLSQDDPFMLYAALYSGLGTFIVSRDLMRGHKFLLANPKLQTTFQKWLSKYQYFIASIGYNDRVYFQEPVNFLQTIQQNSKGDWHIPYVVRGEELTTRDRVDHLHRHWLCLQKSPPRDSVKLTRIKPETERAHPRNDKLFDKPLRKPTGKVNIRSLFEDDQR